MDRFISGEAYKQNKKHFETSHGSVDFKKYVFKLKSHGKAMFSRVQYCHPAEGYNFLFPGR